MSGHNSSMISNTTGRPYFLLRGCPGPEKSPFLTDRGPFHTSDRISVSKVVSLAADKGTLNSRPVFPDQAMSPAPNDVPHSED